MHRRRSHSQADARASTISISNIRTIYTTNSMFIAVGAIHRQTLEHSRTLFLTARTAYHELYRLHITNSMCTAFAAVHRQMQEHLRYPYRTYELNKSRTLCSPQSEPYTGKCKSISHPSISTST